jgi:hypothetical protein
MLVDELRRAVEASPRAELHTMSGLLWRAFAAGQVSEAEASALSDLIEAKRAMPAPPPRPRLRVGSRPRTPESLARRRRWAASGALPPALASRFTLAEQAVLAVVAAEHQAHGRCALTIGHIAALAGVCGQTVRNALKHAQALVHVEQRRVAAFRNLPNRTTIISREWLSWLRLRRGGSKLVEGTHTQENNQGASELRGRAWAAEHERVGRAAPSRPRRRPEDDRHPRDQAPPLLTGDRPQ